MSPAASFPFSWLIRVPGNGMKNSPISEASRWRPWHCRPRRLQTASCRACRVERWCHWAAAQPAVPVEAAAFPQAMPWSAGPGRTTAGWRRTPSARRHHIAEAPPRHCRRGRARARAVERAHSRRPAAAGGRAAGGGAASASAGGGGAFGSAGGGAGAFGSAGGGGAFGSAGGGGAFGSAGGP